MERVDTSEPVLRDPVGGRLPRRKLFERFGWGGLTALIVLCLPGLVRFLRPNGSRAGTGDLHVGSIHDYRTPMVATQWVGRHQLWIVNRDSRLFAIEARCTHLGCTPRWMPERGIFHCPCHGSRFSPEGLLLRGPATQPLYRLAIRVEHDQVLIDPSRREPLDDAELDPRFWVAV